MSLREALKLRHDYIGTEHIAIALASSAEGLAASVIREAGATRDAVTEAVMAELGQTGPDALGDNDHSAASRIARAVRGRGRGGKSAEGPAGELVSLALFSPAVRSAIDKWVKFMADIEAKEPGHDQLLDSGQLTIFFLSDKESHARKAADAAGIDVQAFIGAIIETPVDGTSDEAPGARRLEIELPDAVTARAARDLTAEQVAEAITKYLSDVEKDPPR